ncbi:MAG: dihydroorotate dehydrogenase [Bryobacteraceae bacterium]
MLPRYDIRQSYDWNYEHAPDPPRDLAVPDWPGAWNFCGVPVRSPLGIPAGPLLNSRWILYYAALGFDVLTYKTVRSRRRDCYPPPNLLPVRPERLSGEGFEVEATPDEAAIGAWAISFGMPSKEPPVWQSDVEKARRGLADRQVLVVSVVASPQPGWTIDEVAADFARCARWAADSGAHAVEANLSCPNVCTAEGDLYRSAEASAVIAAELRRAVPELPLLVKVGLFANEEEAAALIEAVAPHLDAISATNSITAFVRSPQGERLFDGLRRGIGGVSIGERCLEELEMLARLVRERKPSLNLVSVGGVSTRAAVCRRLECGAHHVQIATAAMLDPLLAVRIRAGHGNR